MIKFSINLKKKLKDGLQNSMLNNKINKLLQTMAEIVVGEAGKGEALGFQLWPFHPEYGFLFFAPAWLDRFYSILRKIKERQISNEKIAGLFKAPSRIVQIFWILGSIRQSRLNEKQRIWLVEQLLDLLNIYRKNIFCEDGKNIIWDSIKVKKVGKDVELNGITGENLFKLLYSLESTLWMYTELIYFMGHPLGHSFQGPYQMNSRKLVVRRYFYLKPEFWKFTQKLAFNEVEILELYSKDAEIQFGFDEKGFKTSTIYRDKFIKFKISVNNKQLVTEGELKNALDNLNEVAKRGIQHIQTLDKKDLIAKFAESWFYLLKPFCDFLGEDWHPPKEIYDNIYKRFNQIDQIWENIKKQWEETANLSREQKMEAFKKNFDPRD